MNLQMTRPLVNYQPGIDSNKFSHYPDPVNERQKHPDLSIQVTNFDSSRPQPDRHLPDQIYRHLIRATSGIGKISTNMSTRPNSCITEPAEISGAVEILNVYV